jgi:thiamine transporter
VVAEAGMAVALAAVLKMLPAPRLVAGGSVTPGCLAPLWAFSARHGWRRGVMVGACFGAIDLMLNPAIVHWAQVLLDYPLAFATVGLVGLPGLPLPARVALSAVARYAIHVASGVVFFAANAPADTPALAFSAVYNLYVFPDALVAAVLLAAIARRLPVTALDKTKTRRALE